MPPAALALAILLHVLLGVAIWWIAPQRPPQRTQPLSPRPAPPAPQRPPADMPATMPSPMPGPDPGDVLIGQGRQRNDYLSRVARQIAQYRVYPASALTNNQGGRVVMRV